VADSSKRRRTAREKLRLAVLVLAVAYPLALLFVLALMRGIGERWWPTTVLLYLPRVGFLLPLPPLVLALLFVRPRRWLLTQLAAALILLFPLMGLHLGGSRAAAAGAHRLRVLSCNVDLASASVGALAAAIRAAAPDLVLLQEAPDGEAGLLARELPGYLVRGDAQFVVASKYAILDVYLTPPTGLDRIYFAPSFARYRIDAPGGPIDVFNMHPTSPHGAFDHLRGPGLLHELVSGRIFVNHDAIKRIYANTALRTLQVRTLAEHAHVATNPVLIAGDTNMPAGSRILGEYLGGYQDGFAEAGRGFGYTFPARRAPAWLRLDRVLADRSFRFVAFSRLDVHVSTHYPVLTDLERTGQNALQNQ
jgi:endonuclease/exonuclease/phosphatase family metal-dependent hydrolase